MAFLHELTIDGRACILVLPDRDWKVRPKISHNFETIESEAMSGIEGRSPSFLSMRLGLEYSYELDPAIADEWLQKFRALGTRRLAFPLAPDDLAAAEYTDALRIYSPAHFVNYDRATGAFVLDGSGGYDSTTGLVLCKITEHPKTIARTDMHAQVSLRAFEDSPFASRVRVNTLATPAWSWEPDYVSSPEVLAKWRTKFRQMGKGREQAFSGEDAPTKKGQKALISLSSRNEIRSLLTFWCDKRGAHKPFVAPEWFKPGWDGTGSPPDFQARFGQDSLQLEFLTQDDARTNVTLWQQLILTGGQPDQDRPPFAFLVRAWWSGSTNNHAWTDWEEPITHAGVTYQTKNIGVEPPTETLRAGENDWEFSIDDFDGNPLRAFTLQQIERPLNVEIWECNPESPAAAVLRFVGEVLRAPSTGKVYTATAALLGGRLRRLTPNFYDQPDCNYDLYSEEPECGVSRAAHEQSGTVAVINGLIVDVTTAAAQAADYFAAGDAEFGAGETIERRYVIRSVPITGGQRLTLQRPLNANGVGAAVKFYPGCDGQFGGGCLKFGNQNRFGGFEWKPPYIDGVQTGFKPQVGK